MLLLTLKMALAAGSSTQKKVPVGAIKIIPNSSVYFRGGSIRRASVLSNWVVAIQGELAAGGGLSGVFWRER